MSTPDLRKPADIVEPGLPTAASGQPSRTLRAAAAGIERLAAELDRAQVAIRRLERPEGPPSGWQPPTDQAVTRSSRS